jgi:hypothetical protein
MMLASLFRPPHVAHSSVARDGVSSYWVRRGLSLHVILEAGRFTIHDVVNDPRIRGAVAEQWRLGRIMDEDFAVARYVAYLEYVEAALRGEVPGGLR